MIHRQPLSFLRHRQRCRIALVLVLLLGTSPMNAVAASARQDAPDTRMGQAPAAVEQPAAAPGHPEATAATVGKNPDARSQTVSTLPQNVTVLSMYQHADWVVKIVLIGLVIASIINWAILLAKAVELLVVKRQQRTLLATVRQARSLAEVSRHFASDRGKRIGSETLVEAASEELRLSADVLNDRDGLKERVAIRLERAESAIGRKILIGTGVLATIGATAPFVGLFGTVWGIMHSFIGISQSHTTNLAVVAPGIAEALLATACGLIAAIPAVVIYNYLARRITGYKALVADTSSALLGLVSRDLSRGTTDRALLTEAVE